MLESYLHDGIKSRLKKEDGSSRVLNVQGRMGASCFLNLRISNKECPTAEVAEKLRNWTFLVGHWIFKSFLIGPLGH
jgi:hypothetical protein